MLLGSFYHIKSSQSGIVQIKRAQKSGPTSWGTRVLEKVMMNVLPLAATSAGRFKLNRSCNNEKNP
jgi:hypothetical protein